MLNCDHLNWFRWPMHWYNTSFWLLKLIKTILYFVVFYSSIPSLFLFCLLNILILIYVDLNCFTDMFRLVDFLQIQLNILKLFAYIWNINFRVFLTDFRKINFQMNVGKVLNCTKRLLTLSFNRENTESEICSISFDGKKNDRWSLLAVFSAFEYTRM